jgi:RNA polymerase sigma factor (sigma-70 family)
MDMAASQMNRVIQHLRRAALVQDCGGMTDGQLLADFINSRNEGALEALVRRHGPMVWGVCRRVLFNHHDAEDAFQATFLVLLRKAASISRRELLANWLYGVAHQTALKARATTAKNRSRERQVTQMPEPESKQQELWHELEPLLDQELSRLPQKYRSAVVLCDLQGKTRKEAARQLGCPEGTVAGRLARARALLARRLAARGLAVSSGSLAVMLSQNAASAGMPATVITSTIKTACMCTGAISAQVAALAEGVLKAMFFTKLKTGALLMLLVLSAVPLASGLWAWGQSGEVTDAGTLQAKPNGAVDKRAEADKEAISWGKAVDGLQAGIGFRPGEKPSCRFAQSLNFIIYLRNVSDKKIDLSHIETVFEEFLLTVEDMAGKRQLVVPGPRNLGHVSIVKRSLEARETIRFGSAWLMVVEKGTKGEATGPTLVATRGKYKVSHGGFPLRRGGNDFDEQKWPTGKIEVWINNDQDAGQKPKQAPVPNEAKADRPLTLDAITAKMLRDPGNRFDVELVGRFDGVVSGTDLYFYDSHLDTAAVHAGLVKPGEKAVITVTVVKCPKSGVGSIQNGVKSSPWDEARATDTAFFLQRRNKKDANQKSDELKIPKGDERPSKQKPAPVSLDEAVKNKLNQKATIELEVTSATMAWTTGFGQVEPWIIRLTPKQGLKDGSKFELCLTSKAVTHLRNLSLLSENDRKSADFFRGKLIRMTGNVESWADRDKKEKTIYRMCVHDLDHFEVVR